MGGCFRTEASSASRVGDQPRHRQVIVRPRAVPQGKIRIRSQIQPSLLCPFPQPGQCVSHDRRVYGGLHACSIGRHKQPGALLAVLHGPAALVNQVMMVGTEQHQIVCAGFAPVQPVLHMVTMQESVVRAAGKNTTAVAQLQHPANCRRYRTRATADVQGCASTVHGHQPTITSHAPKRFRGNVGTVFQGCGQHPVRSQRIEPGPAPESPGPPRPGTARSPASPSHQEVDAVVPLAPPASALRLTSVRPGGRDRSFPTGRLSHRAPSRAASPHCLASPLD